MNDHITLTEGPIFPEVKCPMCGVYVVKNSGSSTDVIGGMSITPELGITYRCKCGHTFAATTNQKLQTFGLPPVNGEDGNT